MAQLEQKKRKHLLYELSEENEKNSRLRNSRDSLESELGKSDKRMQTFLKESKKILMSE